MFLLVSVLWLVLLSCEKKEDSGEAGENVSEMTAISRDEAAMAEEETPDFSSPASVDETLVVDSIPEEVIWYTSKPGIWGSSRAKQGGTFREAITEFPQTFRTLGPNANGSFRGVIGESPGLLEKNPHTKEWIPALATHWAAAADGQTAYYRLNKNARWTDGTPITSADYVFMLEMMRSEHIQAPWYNDYYTNNITDLKAYDDYTISVTANVPMELDILIDSTTVGPRPKHHYNGVISENFVDDYQWVFEPHAGAYYLDTFEKGEIIIMRKVKDWWGHVYDYNKHRFNFETIEYQVITGGQDVIESYFYNGEFDKYLLIIPKKWEESENQDNIINGYIDRYYTFYIPIEGIRGFCLNVQAPIFRDVNVRRGLYYSLNVQKMIDTVLRGAYSRYHNIGLGHVFAGVNFDNEEIRKPDFDPAKAGELFSLGGFDTIGADGIRANAAGERLQFELLYSSDGHTERLAVIKEEAKKAGLEVNLKLMTEGLFATVREKQHEAWWGGMTTSSRPSYWQYFHSDNAHKPQTNNFFGYANPEMDKLLDAVRDESKLNKKAELTKQIQQIIHDDAVIVPSYYVPYTRAASWKWIRYPRWLNMRYDDSTFYAYRRAFQSTSGYQWFDEEIYAETTKALTSGKALEARTYILTTYKKD